MKGMGHALSQELSSVSVWAFYVFVSVGLCLSSSTAKTVTPITKTTTTTRQQQEQHKPITTKESSDGSNEDVGDENETRQIEYWSFWRRSFSPLQWKAVFPSSLLVFMPLKLSVASSAPLAVLVVYVLV